MRNFFSKKHYCAISLWKCQDNERVQKEVQKEEYQHEKMKRTMRTEQKRLQIIKKKTFS